MNAIINYTAWFNIFALAFSLINYYIPKMTPDELLDFMPEIGPSEEELLLAEVGERIRYIATEGGSQKVKAIMKEHDTKKKKIKYMKFKFIHMDVMGSGRYFYVEGIEKVNLKLF